MGGYSRVMGSYGDAKKKWVMNNLMNDTNKKKQRLRKKKGCDGIEVDGVVLESGD